jgi:hypothetical protein
MALFAKRRLAKIQLVIICVNNPSFVCLKDLIIDILIQIAHKMMICRKMIAPPQNHARGRDKSRP